jgi:hypothetical protein
VSDRAPLSQRRNNTIFPFDDVTLSNSCHRRLSLSGTTSHLLYTNISQFVKVEETVNPLFFGHKKNVHRFTKESFYKAPCPLSSNTHQDKGNDSIKNFTIVYLWQCDQIGRNLATWATLAYLLLNQF